MIIMRKICCLLLITLYTTILHAQGSHWSVNIYDYEYDMSVYAELIYDGEKISDYSNLEVASFVGDECRGVGVVLSKDGYTWVSVRVRSNIASGETVYFKIYNKTTGTETMSLNSVVFEYQGCLGMPSSPIQLSFKTPVAGDANLDGKVSVADVAFIVSYLNGKTPDVFCKGTADYDGNGAIDQEDINQIVKHLLQEK